MMQLRVAADNQYHFRLLLCRAERYLWSQSWRWVRLDSSIDGIWLSTAQIICNMIPSMPSKNSQILRGNKAYCKLSSQIFFPKYNWNARQHSGHTDAVTWASFRMAPPLCNEHLFTPSSNQVTHYTARVQGDCGRLRVISPGHFSWDAHRGRSCPQPAHSHWDPRTKHQCSFVILAITPKC